MSLLKNFSKILTDSRKEAAKKRFQKFEAFDADIENPDILAFGDNLDFMKCLKKYEGMEGKIQQIYIDPPFFSKANYDAVIKV